MKSSTMLKTLPTKEGELIYQTVTSDAFALYCEEYPTAFSVLVAHTAGDAVTETAFAYDVSRDMEICDQITEQLWQKGTLPKDLLDTIAELL